MTTISLHIGVSAVSMAITDEWGGTNPLLPDASFHHDGYEVQCGFAQQAGQGFVGRNAEALLMSAQSGGAPVKYRSGAFESPAELVAPTLGAANSELMRKRLSVGKVVLATADAADSPDVAMHVLAVRSAGWCSPVCLPASLCVAADLVLNGSSARPVLVLKIGYESVTAVEVLPAGTTPGFRQLASRSSLGFASIWQPLVHELAAEFSAQSMPADKVHCEAVRFARLLLERGLQSRPDPDVARVAFRGSEAIVERFSTLPCIERFAAWFHELSVWLTPYTEKFEIATLWVECQGVPGLSQAIVSRLLGATQCKWTVGLDPAVGAARIVASSADVQTISQQFERLPRTSNWRYGTLRPNGTGGTEFRALGALSDLAIQQKLALKTTREDQVRMVLPIGIQQGDGEAITLGILEFPLAAPAKKGVVVEFYIEHEGPLIRVRGISGQPVCPVGEAFLPLDPSLANSAAAYRAFASQMGAVA